MPIKRNDKNSNKNQKGGRVTLPSEYFGKNSGRYFNNNEPIMNISDSAYGKNYPTSRGVLINNNTSGPDLGPTSHSGIQTGGRVTMPSEYYGNKSGRYFDNNDSKLKITDSAYGKNFPTSRGVLIKNNTSGPELGATSHNGIQTGGFKYITNPESGRKVNINGKTGQKVLKNYIDKLYQ